LRQGDCGDRQPRNQIPAEVGPRTVSQ
jgi:hypothetical protein